MGPTKNAEGRMRSRIAALEGVINGLRALQPLKGPGRATVRVDVAGLAGPAGAAGRREASNVAATTGATGSYPLAAEASNVATCFTPPSGIINSVGNSWNAISVTSGGTLSIYEW